MRKRIIAVVCIIALASGLVSCVKTPDKKIVVDKSKGLSEENIIPKEKDKKPKDFEAPAHWKETIEKSNGYVTLTADYEMNLPDIYNTPVYSYENVPMTDELLEKLCSYFSEGNKLYENPAMTKSELSAQKDKMAGYKGDWGYYNGNLNNALNTLMGQVDDLIEKAPENKAEYKYLEARLMKPQQAGVECIGQRWNTFGWWGAWYYDTDEKIGFTARVDKGRDIDPIVRAISYDEKVGSTSSFLFSQGTFVDEIQLDLLSTLQKAQNNGQEEYLNYLTKEIEKADYETFTKEDALKKADKILKDLSIEGLKVTDCAKAVGTADSESWAGLDEVELPKSAGYSIYLSPKAGDVVGYSLPRAAKVHNDLPETMYAPSFLTERIHIIVTEEGIQRFEWANISKRNDTIAENTKLLSFEDIKEKLTEHLLYAGIAKAGGAKIKGIENEYIVKSVQLRAANINAYEDTSAVWLVPVWVFELESLIKETTEEQTKVTDSGPEVVVLNAIDGGFVTLQTD